MNISDFYKDVGHRVKKARLANKPPVSQETLGSMLNMSRTSIVNIEQGKHHIQLFTLFLVAQKLQVDVINLIPENPKEQSVTSKSNRKVSSKEFESIKSTITSNSKKKVIINE